jgi:hypothetical protein
MKQTQVQQHLHKHEGGVFRCESLDALLITRIHTVTTTHMDTHVHTLEYIEEACSKNLHLGFEYLEITFKFLKLLNDQNMM